VLTKQVQPVVLTLACLCVQYLFGWGAVIWTYAFPVVIGWHSIFLVNSAAHLWGCQPYDTGAGIGLQHKCVIGSTLRTSGNLQMF